MQTIVLYLRRKCLEAEPCAPLTPNSQLGAHAGDVVGSGPLFDGLGELRLALDREKEINSANNDNAKR